MAAVTTGAHRAALLGADVVVIPEGVGDGPSSLADFVALALSARVAIVGTYLDSVVDAKTNSTTTSECLPSLPSRPFVSSPRQYLLPSLPSRPFVSSPRQYFGGPTLAAHFTI
jgi:hypothetical protein